MPTIETTHPLPSIPPWFAACVLADPKHAYRVRHLIRTDGRDGYVLFECTTCGLRERQTLAREA